MAELTPMMKQYLEVKEQNPGCILFFRLGDFYEMFSDDATLVSQELDLTLTTRDRGKENPADRIPMCGVPYHSSESYIARLVSKGYKVAICEQMEDPSLAKGLVRRDVIRIVTPGTVTEHSMLEERQNNYYASLYGKSGQFGLSFCDLSTGAFYATSASGNGAIGEIENELSRFQPSEILLGGDAVTNAHLRELLSERLRCCMNDGREAAFDLEACRMLVTAQFDSSCDAPSLLDNNAICAAGALLSVMRDTQKNDLTHIRKLEAYQAGTFMALDLTVRRNLELTETMRTHEKRGSLLWVLDKTKTAMGGRMLRSWLEKPLLNPAQIEQRLNAVDELYKNTVDREELILQLRRVSDIERIMARIVTGTANCRDLVSFSAGVSPLPEIRRLLLRMSSPLLRQLSDELDTLSDLKDQIDRAIVDEPPFTVREGGMIRPGYHEEVDRLHAIAQNGKGMLTAIETTEKEKSGIRNMKIGYNRVFGYYIEVSKGQTELVPEYFIRKQTLSNCERYITPELKELEQNILTAKERLTALEYDLFTELRQTLAAESARVQSAAHAAACTDVLCCFAAISAHNHYCRPQVDLSQLIDITDGRHPVVEQMQKNALFVPNDCKLGTEGCQVAIITGPNMAGKSTYMRQVALIVLMAQIGCFVPARTAHIGVVDRLFTRIGASDDLAAGQSTFMVEMREVADILKYTTPRSLLILDEIGRGTSTFDGMAIAQAVLEYVADPKKHGAKTMFATHYHELTALSNELPGVKNFNIAVKRRHGDMIFLRKIIPGVADGSYGVEVAKLAGLPEKVVARAREILKELETTGASPTRIVEKEPADQISLGEMGDAHLRARLTAVSLETLTPLEALNLLYELKQLL